MRGERAGERHCRHVLSLVTVRSRSYLSDYGQAPPRKFPKCWQPDLLIRWVSLSAAYENTEAKAMGRTRSPAIVQAGPGRSWRIEDSSRAGPSRRISKANGANDGDTVEEVARAFLPADQLDGLKCGHATHHPVCAARKFLPPRAVRNLTDIVHPPSLASTPD